MAGSFKDHEGFRGNHLPLDYYDIHLDPEGEITLEIEEDNSVMVFTLLGNITIEGREITEKTAAMLTKGNTLTIKNTDDFAQVLFISTKELKEPVAWAGPIVMNTEKELDQAFEDLKTGNFIREELEFED